MTDTPTPRAAAAAAAAADAAENGISIHYEKASSFRETPCDGVMGGLTPSGKFWMALYSERFPVPQTTKLMAEVANHGTHLQLSGMAQQEVISSKEGIIRTLEFGSHMTLDTARDLHAWLTEALKQAEAVTTHV